MPSTLQNQAPPHPWTPFVWHRSPCIIVRLGALVPERIYQRPLSDKRIITLSTLLYAGRPNLQAQLAQETTNTHAPHNLVAVYTCAMIISLSGTVWRTYGPRSFVSRNFASFYATTTMTSSPSLTKETRLDFPTANGGLKHNALALPISEGQDDPTIRAKYRPFLLDSQGAAHDWVSELELDTVTAMALEDLEKTGSRLKVLVLYGSLRKRSVPELTWPTPIVRA